MNTIIYPTLIAKYKGTITSNNIVVINGKSKTFKTRDEAFDFLKLVNIKEGWVKNLIHVFDDYCEVELGNSLRMKFDKKDIDLVQSFVLWPVKRHQWYAVFNYHNKVMLFHNYLFMEELVKHNNYTVDHINQNSLDNRRLNLRLASKTTQSFNRHIHSHNKSGVNGVFFVIKDGREYWVAKWLASGVQHQKYFNVKKYINAKELATQYRDEMNKLYYLE